MQFSDKLMEKRLRKMVRISLSRLKCYLEKYLVADFLALPRRN